MIIFVIFIILKISIFAIERNKILLLNLKSFWHQILLIFKCLYVHFFINLFNRQQKEEKLNTEESLVEVNFLKKLQCQDQLELDFK
jgi:hypothetical protein